MIYLMEKVLIFSRPGNDIPDNWEMVKRKGKEFIYIQMEVNSFIKDEYEGNFLNDKFNGNGTLKLANGSKI